MKTIPFGKKHRVLVMHCIAFFFLALFSAPAMAQRTLYGQLLDSLSGEPVAGATIYADQTQTNATSDAKGFFRLSGISPKTTIIVTHTGYEKTRAEAGGSRDTLVLRLLRRAVALENVTLDGNTKNTNNWTKWGRLFTSVLIGNNMEKECILKNPEDVRFDYDKKTMLLKAHARQTLKVENHLLGYRLNIDLDSLVYSVDRGTMLYVMSAYFERMEENDLSLQKIKAANRLRAYRGSRMHFARALYRRKLDEEGFSLYHYRGTLNEEKERVERILLASLAERNEPLLRESVSNTDLSYFGKDTARYYKRVLGQPACYFEDSLPVYFNTRWREGASGVLFYLGTDSLLLVYKEAKDRAVTDNELRKWASLKEPVTALYSSGDFLKAGNRREKYSLLHLLSGSQIAIRQNGFVEESSSLFMQGYMATNRLGHDLPWDYDPVTDEAQLMSEQQLPANAASQVIDEQWDRMSKSHSSSELYLHLDKTIYDTGENIWFAAYLLRSPFKPEDHHTLYVALQDPESKKIIASEKFMMEAGLGAGYLYLTDSFPAGTYHLLAYTNTFSEEKNAVVFDQAITIRPTVQSYAVVYDAAANHFANDSVWLVCQVKEQNGKPAAGTLLSYRLVAGGELIADGNTMTNDKGELLLPPQPLKKTSGKKLLLYTDVQQGQHIIPLRNEITLPGKYLKVKWYPEGGVLVNGVASRMAYEVKEANGQPSGIPLQLYTGNKLAGTLNTDGKGHGVIELTPVSGNSYSVGAADQVTMVENNFPAVEEQGVVLYADKGVVTDSLRFQVRPAGKPAPVYVMVHDFKSRYYFDKMQVAGNEQLIALAADELPEGLITVTLFDEEARPVAERSFFKEPTVKPVLTIIPDSTFYHTRSKVRLKLSATDNDGNPLRAVVSLACVLNSRVDTGRFQDIVPFHYFNSYKAAGVTHGKADYFQYRAKELEDFLLIQCWTKYKWQEAGTGPEEVTAARHSLVQRGKVFYKGGSPGKPVELMLVSPEKVQTVSTDADGYFELSQTMLTTIPDWRIMLAVNAANQGDYRILLEDGNEKLQQALARADYPEPGRTKYLPVTEESLAVKTLAPVTVFSRNENKAADALKMFKRAISKSVEECKDYVCFEGYLNCPIHSTGTKPQFGRVYHLCTQCGDIRLIYNQCWDGGNFLPTVVKLSTDTVVCQLKGRYYSKEFYANDFEKNNLAFADLHTTMYWNPLVQTDEKGEAVLSFFTNDLTGRLAVVAEGISGKLPLSARKIVVVKK